MSTKHEFTVAETFGGLGVAITISMADMPDGFPHNVTGEMVARNIGRLGTAARDITRDGLSAVQRALKQKLFDETAAIAREKREAEESDRKDAIAKAVEAAKAEAAEKFSRDLAAYQAQWERDQAEVDADNKFLASRVGTLSDELAALKTAKRSAAARKGHSRARKAGRA